MPKILKNTTFLILATLFFTTIPAFAQSLTDFQILKYNTIEDLLNAITTFLINLAPIVAGLVLIYGGYLYFLGGFDQKADGRRAIQAAIIGLIIVLSYDIIKALVIGTISGGTFNTAPIIKFLTEITTSLIGLSSIFAIAVIIYGGYKYMFSSLPGAKGDGKDAITNGILGLVAIIIAGPLVELIKATITGTSTLNINKNAIQAFILNIISNFLIPISSIVTIFFFVVGGYYMLTSGGNAAQFKKGQDYLRNALIGLIIILASFTIVQLVLYVVNGISFT
ncbi:MAG: TrbC/VirB2 family protein [candidate division SR1 bacterium]|nr:TrbC/VirB2 family protein [candidate division SR1 bacterium]